MALTRKMLKAMGIEDEKIEQIIEEHADTVDALKQQRDTYKEDADKLEGVQKELDELKAKPDDGFKQKYEDEHKAFEDFKAKAEEEKSNRQKSELYKALLAEAGIDSKRHDAIMRVTNLKDVTIKDGKIEKSDELLKSVSEEWKDFVTVPGKKGAAVDNPPANNPSKEEPKSLAEALRQKYTDEQE